MCFENAGHFFLSSVDAALVYSRIYIAVDIRDLESIQTRRKALTPAESEENSVRLHRGRSNCSGFGVVVPAPPVLPPTALCHLATTCLTFNLGRFKYN